MSMSKELNIYSFTDYREYLRTYYGFRKESEEGFSYRAMSKEMGFTSPNYLKLVIDGDRHIGRSALPKIVVGLGLKKIEAEYLSYLIFFAKAKSSVDKNYYYGLIAEMRNKRVIDTIKDDQYAYYDNWYNTVIRELVVGKSKENIDYSALAREVNPPIHHKQALRSVNLLEEMGFISVDENGQYRHASPLINTGNEASSYAIKQYHSKMINLGKESIEKYPSPQREISACTVRVSYAGFDRVKKRIQEFRQELLQMVQEDRDVDRVAQINMQFFPVSLFREGNDE